ncbi:SNF2-related protein [Streptomyces sp. NPDC054933]
MPASPERFARLDAEAFFKVLKRWASRPAPGADLDREVQRRCARGQVAARELHVLLLAATGAGWESVRRVAIGAVAQAPHVAVSVLSAHAQTGAIRPIQWVDLIEGHPPHQKFTAEAITACAGREYRERGAPSRGKKQAQQTAAVALLARLAGVPAPDLSTAAADRADEPDTGTTRLKSGGHPVSALYEYAHVGGISDLSITAVSHSGPSHRPTFTMRAACRHPADSERLVEATGEGTTKNDARNRAAAALVARLLNEATPPPAAARPGPTEPVPAARETESPRTPKTHPVPTPNTLPRPARPTTAFPSLADPADRHSSDGEQAVVQALPSGCRVRFEPGAVPGQDTLHLQQADRGEVRVPLTTGLALLLEAAQSDTAEATVTSWAQAARTGLEQIAAGHVHPAVSDTGYATWHVSPPTDALDATAATLAAALAPAADTRETTGLVWALWNALAEMLMRPPGARYTIGPGPFTADPAVLDPADAAAVDARAARIERATPPALALHIAPPGPGNGSALPLLPARLTLHTHTDGPGPTARVAAMAERTRRACRRVLRAAAAICPELDALARAQDPAAVQLAPAAVLAVRDAAEQLANIGLHVTVDTTMTHSLQAQAVVGTASRPATSQARLSLDQLLDFRWQLTLGGRQLTEDELHALATAAHPLIQLRDQWVLIDPAIAARARHPSLDPLPAGQALTAALTGTISIDGATVPCTAADGLADVVTLLRAGDAATTIPGPVGLKAELRDYQQRGLSWLASRTRLGMGAILADDMGLGKTLTALALHLHRQQDTSRPSLVVCPTSLLPNWAREAARFTPDTPVLRYYGPDRTLDDLVPGMLVVTTYALARQDTGKLAAIDWDLLLVDEAQHVKNPATETAQALRRLHANATVALTGTPMENCTTDLWAQLDLTNRGLFGTRHAFHTTFGKPSEADPGGAVAAQLRRLVGPFLLRRTKDDPRIAPELPPKLYTERAVPLAPEQTGLYEAKVRATIDRIRRSTGIERSGMVLSLISALRQICNHPAPYLKEDLAAATSDLDACVARSGKLQALDDLVTAIRARGESALIFTDFATMGHLLHHHLVARGHAPLFLYGDVPVARREKMVDAFQCGRHPLLIATLKAAGTGLNLTRAAHVILYDRPWNPAKESQAVDRAHRIGQNQRVQVHRLICEGTVEDHITALLNHKRALTDAIVTNGESTLGTLTDDELTALVTLGGTR